MRELLHLGEAFTNHAVKTPTNQNLNDYRSVEFSGLVAPENCREYGFGYGVVYLTKNDMATLKSGFIFITPI
jgi:hypothetical protein